MLNIRLNKYINIYTLTSNVTDDWNKLFFLEIISKFGVIYIWLCIISLLLIFLIVQIDNLKIVVFLIRRQL